MTEDERDPLWDPEVEDAELAGLAQALAPLRHDAPLRTPLPARKPPPRKRWPVYAAAFAAAAAIALFLWRPWRGDPPAPPVLAATCAEAGIGFRYQAIAGVPSCGGAELEHGWLPVGGALETGPGDRARLEVADIGEIQLAEGSRLSLVASGDTEHRLALDHGSLHAKVTAPPRLFVIETPTATAVDLGCEYDLEVAADGSGTLRVSSGYVELVGAGRLSLVPMGAGAVTRRGTGPGLPWSLDAAPALRAAIDRYDQGEAAALPEILRQCGERDTVTLFNLLSRVDPDDRGAVYDAIDAIMPIPEWVLRDAVIADDREAIDHLREALEGEWLLASEPEVEEEPDAGPDAEPEPDAGPTTWGP